MSQVDLNNCDREPIHIPGSIQGHGALIVSDKSATTVTRHSGNARQILGMNDEASLIGATLQDMLGHDAVHQLRNALATSQITRRPSLIFDAPLFGRRFDISVHRSGDETLIEFEPKGARNRQPLDLMRSVITRLDQPASIETLVTNAAKLIRAVLGYDRVMIYRFEPEGSGQVIAEAKASRLESFMGQYFPGSDIPQQARTLYLKSTIRIISDADGERVPILESDTDELGPLDMSLAHLRSVSPIHCEYLRNMGVSASMSISIIIDGALWGLVACHHYTTKYLDMAERAALEIFGEVFSLQLDVLRQKRRIAASNATRKALDRLLQEAPLHAEIFELLRQYLPAFSQMIPSDGLALWMNGEVCMHDACPPIEEIRAIADMLGQTSKARVWSTHAISEHLGAAVGTLASGVLAIPLSQRPRDYLLFFRREFEHTLNWAGDPNKSYTSGPLGDRLTPRTSFAIWKETVRNQSRKWSETQREVAEAIRAALVEVVLRHNEILADERGKADLRQRMLNEELNHRVKNILAVIKSLVGQGSSSATIDDYLDTLRGRIQALSVAHDQIVRGDGGGFISNLLAAELRPYHDQTAAIVISGPSVWIDTSTFSVMALVFHELATNAVKYGALSAAGGKLAVHWSVNADNNCELSWEESGGPTVPPPTRRGFGSVLIARSIPHELGGQAEIDYRPGGLWARFVIPARHIALADKGSDEKTLELPDANRDAQKPLNRSDIAVLLVEDQMLIAMDAELMLTSEGLGNIRTASSATEALSALQGFRPTIAILDVNLGNGTSLPIAEELRRLGAPFIFATGYGDGGVIPEQFSEITVIRKPYSAQQLAAAIFAVLA